MRALTWYSWQLIRQLESFWNFCLNTKSIFCQKKKQRNFIILRAMKSILSQICKFPLRNGANPYIVSDLTKTISSILTCLFSSGFSLSRTSSSQILAWCDQRMQKQFWSFLKTGGLFLEETVCSNFPHLLSSYFFSEAPCLVSNFPYANKNTPLVFLIEWIKKRRSKFLVL